MAKKQPEELPRGISLAKGKYRVRLFVDGVQHSLGAYETLTDAKAALAIAKGEKARGTFVPPAQRRAEGKVARRTAEREALTLTEWSERWLERMAANPERSVASVVTHRSVLKVHLLPELGHQRLVDIAPDDIDALMARLRALPSRRNPGAERNGVAPNAARTLRACLNAAVKDRETALASSPFEATIGQARRVRAEDPAGDVATPAEVAAIAAAMPEHLAAAVTLAAWCALRAGEVLGLERRDFENVENLDDTERATLHVRRQVNVKARAITDPKSGSSRSIAIPAFLLDDLRHHLKQHVASGKLAPVFSTPGRPGVRVSQSALDKAWRAARETAGRPGFVFHNLRHTGLTAYAQQGATLAELLYRGGHSDVSVALRYQHATAERDRALTAKLSGLVTEGVGR